jgi:ATP-dependent Clp protease ATP-binding subunit ClpC
VLKQVWAEFGPATEALGQNIDAAIAAGTGPGPYGGGMTPRLTRIVRRAHAIAKERGRGMVPPEYLFLALLDDGQDVAAQVLAALGVTAERLRQILDSPPD